MKKHENQIVWHGSDDYRHYNTIFLYALYHIIKAFALIEGETMMCKRYQAFNGYQLYLAVHDPWNV